MTAHLEITLLPGGRYELRFGNLLPVEIPAATYAQLRPEDRIGFVGWLTVLADLHVKRKGRFVGDEHAGRGDSGGAGLKTAAASASFRPTLPPPT